jgi:ABC-type nitrate/sulfonate/bicarbonate transport system substrate-binding protein
VLALIAVVQALTVAVSGPPSSLEYLPVRAAVAGGHFEREGLAVALRTTDADAGAAEALALAQVDLAATSLGAMLRFGPRAERQGPRLLLGLTPAPPVALLVPARPDAPVRSVEDLAGRRVGVAVPGAPENAWLVAVLARAGVRVAEVRLVSLGSRALAPALSAGEVDAALVEEPLVSRLLGEGEVRMLADLRGPAAVERAVAGITVSAAVFARADRLPPQTALTAFARAVLAATQWLAREPPDAVAARLPRSVLGPPEDVASRLGAARGLYLTQGRLTSGQLRRSIELLRAHHPFPVTLEVPRADDLLLTGPLKRAIRSLD